MSVSVIKHHICEHNDFVAVYLDTIKCLEKMKPGGTQKVAFMNAMILLHCIQEMGA